MLNPKQKKVATVFLIINIVLLLLLGIFAFYGNSVDKYKRFSDDGIDDRKGLFDVIKMRYFSNEDDYKDASLVIIDIMENAMKPDGNNCELDTSIGFKTKNNDQINVYTKSKIDNNKVNGIIYTSLNKEDIQENEFYFINDGDCGISLYINHDAKWYLYKKDIEINWLDYATIIEAFKNMEYDFYPEKEFGYNSAKLDPKSDYIETIHVCECKKLGSIKFKELQAAELLEFIAPGMQDTILSKLIQNKYKCTFNFDPKSFGEMTVELPEYIIQSAIVIDDISFIFENVSNQLFAAQGIESEVTNGE